MENLIIIAILILIIGVSLAYIIKAKKRGVKCIGCPDSGKCSSQKQADSSCSGCGCSACSNCTGCSHN